MRRREFIRDFSLCDAATATLLLPWQSSMAQPETKPVIAWLGTLPKGKSLPSFMVETTLNNFKRGLSDAGYVHGRNIEVIRQAEVFPDRIASIDETIARLTPLILLAPATLQAVAARKAMSTIPIVCAALADAVHLGLIASKAHPGGNVTGIEPYIAGLPKKQIELREKLHPPQGASACSQIRLTQKVHLRSAT
jgi:ABC-type uncharacterized transport system substrate-binding protein